LRGEGKEIQIVGSKPRENHWIRTFTGYHVLEVQGFKELLFNCISREVSSIEGSYEHVAHPIGGVAWLTGGVTTSAKRKVEAGDRWWTHVSWGGVNPLLTIAYRGLVKEEHEGSTLQLAKLRVARGARVRP
jgi:hypothetical protein